MKLTLKAFKDADGRSCSVDFMPDATDEKKEQVFSDAQTLHKFPVGVLRLEKHYSEASSIAMFISDEVAAFTQKEAVRREAIEKTRRDEEAARKEAGKYLVAANKILANAAAKRNAAIVALSTAQDSLAGQMLAERKDAILKKIPTLQAAQEAAVSEFKWTLEQLNIVRSVKSTPEEKHAALVALKIIKADESISQPEAPAAS